MMFRRYDCSTVSDMLPLHAGGDLDPRHQAAVDEHLHACLNCFREFRELASLRGQLQAAADEPLPDGILDGFTEEVMARVRLGASGPAAAPPTVPPARLRLPRMLAAAAFVVAAGLAVTLMVESREAGSGSGPDLPFTAANVVASRMPSGKSQAIGWPAPSIRDVGGTLPAGYGGAPQGTPASSSFGNGLGSAFGSGVLQRSNGQLMDAPSLFTWQQVERLLRQQYGNVQVQMHKMELPAQPSERLHLFLLSEGHVQQLAEADRFRVPVLKAATAIEDR